MTSPTTRSGSAPTSSASRSATWSGCRSSAAAEGSPAAASRPSALFGLFARISHLATVQTLLNGAGSAAARRRRRDRVQVARQLGGLARRQRGAAHAAPRAGRPPRTWSPEADTVLRGAARPGLGLARGAHRRPGGERPASHGRLGGGGRRHRARGGEDQPPSSCAGSGRSC